MLLMNFVKGTMGSGLGIILTRANAGLYFAESNPRSTLCHDEDSHQLDKKRQPGAKPIQEMTKAERRTNHWQPNDQSTAATNSSHPMAGSCPEIPEEINTGRDTCFMSAKTAKSALVESFFQVPFEVVIESPFASRSATQSP